jgi:hypothetical protein
MTHCPETGRACELACGLGRVCSRLRSVRCIHDRHPGECGQCLAGSSAFGNSIRLARGVIADVRPGLYRVTINDRREIADMTYIEDDHK